MDEHDFEVTDLRPQPRGVLPQRSHQPSWPRRRALTGALVIVALLATVAALLLRAPGGTALVAGLFPTPTPTPPLRQGDDLLYVAYGVSWATLTVDGHAVAQPDIARKQRTLHLPRGQHTLTYTAEPWPVLRCVFSVPPRQSDTCPLVPANGLAVVGDTSGATRIVNLRPSVDRLPAEARAALESQVRQTLTPSPPMPISPRDHYIGADGAIHQATAPLTASLISTLNTDPSRPPTTSQIGLLNALPQGCVTLCDDAENLPATWAWPIYAHVLVGWRYTDQQGQVIASMTPTEMGGNAAGGDLALPLEVTRTDGRWQVVDENARNGMAICSLAMAAVGDLLARGGAPQAQLIIIPYGMPPRSDGCVITIQANNDQGQLSGPQGQVLYRFGAVLALNTAARTFAPAMPLATDSERAIAEHIKATLPPTGDEG